VRRDVNALRQARTEVETAPIFFLLWMVIASFIMVNLFIACILVRGASLRLCSVGDGDCRCPSGLVDSMLSRPQPEVSARPLWLVVVGTGHWALSGW
jgi:hypothetical protein